jgi:pimeloyl-ACP methyl ester carboxylesterase
MQDRSTFEELKQGVIDFLLSEQEKDESYTANSAESEDSDEEESSIGRGIRIANLFASRGSESAKPERSARPVYFIGESFGGILASEVALTLLGSEKSPALKGMALINAATCYDRSKLASEGPAVAQLHPFLYPAGLLKIFSLVTDEYSVDQLLLILRGEALPSIIDDEIREAYMGRVAISLPSVLKFMPQETLRWRINEWCETGCTRMASRLPDFRQHQSFQTLIVAGERDGTLPSSDEAERLAGVFPDAVVHVVDGAGHASTCGSRVDLAALFRSHFRELGQPKLRQRSSNPRTVMEEASSPRTVMKEAAAAGEGKYFGMEPRYDGKTIGISPLTHWSRKYYRKVQSTSANANATKATAADE